MSFGFPLLAGFTIVYALFARRLSTTPVTGPMLFTAFGVVMGSSVIGLIEPERNLEGVRLLLEVTLVIVLFTDAFALHTSRWREDAVIPARLLGIGLPLTMVAGWAVALLLFPDLEVWEAGLVGVLLAPTDAALGQAVVANKRVPERIRQALNVESGLNDGLALPVFFVFLEVAKAAEGSARMADILVEIVRELAIAGGIGIAVGVAGAFVLKAATERRWTDSGWSQIMLGALALAAWATADAAGGSGFIAAWVAGAAFGPIARESLPSVHDFAEESGHLLSLLSMFVFGAVALGPKLGELTWAIVLYAGLSLTAIRMIPVAIAMGRSHLDRPTIAYLGWFGPRGLASMILVLIVIQESDLAGGTTITRLMVATVGLSVFAHGATAAWGANRYADWCERHPSPAAIPGSPRSSTFRLSRRLGG